MTKRFQDQRRREAWRFLQTGELTGSMAPYTPSGNGIAPGGLGGGIPEKGYVPRGDEDIAEDLGDSGAPGDPATTVNQAAGVEVPISSALTAANVRPVGVVTVGYAVHPGIIPAAERAQQTTRAAVATLLLM